MTTQKTTGLYPIGFRVTHWDGGPQTHGTGTIIAYNGVSPLEYLRTNFKDAVEMAGEAGLIDGLVSSMYDRVRCPYVVRWDVRKGDTEFDNEKREKYPRGYKDVYEHDSIRPLHEGWTIFPNAYTRVMGRTWMQAKQEWGPWMLVPEETYDAYLASDPERKADVDKDWEFCVRPLPENPQPQNSPKDGSFVPLTKWEEGFEGKILARGFNCCDPKGHLPPYEIFVEFEVVDGLNGPIMLKGVTGQLQTMAPGNRFNTVFITGAPGDTQSYSPSRVSRWREVVDPRQFTADMWEYVSPELRPKL